MRVKSSGEQNRWRFEIGRQTEKIAEAALQQLKGEGKIRGFQRQESSGIDFLVVLSDGNIMPLEIKSSFFKAEQHVSVFGREKPVVVILNSSPQLGPATRKRLIRGAKDSILECTAAYKD